MAVQSYPPAPVHTLLLDVCSIWFELCDVYAVVISLCGVENLHPCHLVQYYHRRHCHHHLYAVHCHRPSLDFRHCHHPCPGHRPLLWDPYPGFVVHVQQRH